MNEDIKFDGYYTKFCMKSMKQANYTYIFHLHLLQ